MKISFYITDFGPSIKHSTSDTPYFIRALPLKFLKLSNPHSNIISRDSLFLRPSALN